LTLPRLITAIALAVSFALPTVPVHAQTNAYCQLTPDAVEQKARLRQAAVQGDTGAQEQYRTLVREHANIVSSCRTRTWPQNQAIWLRLYPCDAQPGALAALMDRMVDRGYNEVYVEVFFDGRVLLPSADNPTAWASVVRTPGYENRDLLAEAIALGRERGLKVYAWMFTMNFGYSYGQRPGADQVLAYNGKGQNSSATTTTSINGEANFEEVFIDPYNNEAKLDYYTLVQSVVKRQPDGVLFDYIRYPKGIGSDSIASRVQDLWIYGSASRQALLERAQNQRGLELIRRFIEQGYIGAGDVQAVSSLFPQETEPQWQGRNPALPFATTPPDQLQRYLQTELWQLSVAHAMQGVLDFLALAIYPVKQQNLAAGAVFFPEGNQTIGQGYDSRLQPWDRFPEAIEWHPMSYAICEDGSCIGAQVQTVLSKAPAGTQVKPVLAGSWGEVVSGHPPLEVQMQALRPYANQINAVSHFAHSWQEPISDRDRQFCQLQ
jgi:Glycosyl hydrolase-like 10